MVPPTNQKKVASAKPKKQKIVPKHPKVSEMVDTAILTLKERKGSSTQAIKKYISSQYKVNIDKLSPFINKYLRNSVASGTLIQTKGIGASGSFKFTTQIKEKSSKHKSTASKTKKPAKPVPAKKAETPMKSASTEKYKKVKSKSSKKAIAIKPEVSKSVKKTEIKKIRAVMRVDGTKAPSMYAKNSVNKKKVFHSIMRVDGTKAPSMNAKNSVNKKKVFHSVMRVDGTKAPSMYAKNSVHKKRSSIQL